MPITIPTPPIVEDLIKYACYALRNSIRPVDEEKGVDYKMHIQDASRATDAFYAFWVRGLENCEDELNNELYRLCVKYFLEDEKGLISIGRYEKVQEYGGAEEGGWYYWNYHYVETLKMTWEHWLVFQDSDERRNDKDHSYFVEVVPDTHGKYSKETYQ